MFVEIGSRFNAVRAKIDVAQPENRPDQGVDIDGNARLCILPEHCTDGRDDFACAVTRRYNLTQQVPRLVNVGVFRRKPVQGGAGSRHDACYGLIDLMGDRRREFASGRHAIEMRKFGYGIACKNFGTAAAPMLIDQPRD